MDPYSQSLVDQDSIDAKRNPQNGHPDGPTGISRIMNTMFHTKNHRRAQKQNSRKGFKGPLQISSPIDVIGNTPAAQNLLTNGSIPLQQEEQSGRLTKPPVVFSEAHGKSNMAQVPRPGNLLSPEVIRQRLGHAREALGSHPSFDLHTRTANPRRHGRVFPQSQVSSTLASIQEESATDNNESRDEQVRSKPTSIATHHGTPVNSRRSATSNVQGRRPHPGLHVRPHSSAIRPNGRQQTETGAIRVMRRLQQFLAPLVERDETVSWPDQLETIVRTLVHDQQEEAAAVITLNNMWSLLGHEIPQEGHFSWPEALETKVGEIYEEYKGMAESLDRIDEAVRPSAAEDARDDATWFNQLETAVQSMVQERNQMQCQVVNARAMAQHSERLASSERRKLQEAEKELRRLRRALKAYTPEDEEMSEYIPLASGSRERPLWLLR